MLLLLLRRLGSKMLLLLLLGLGLQQLQLGLLMLLRACQLGLQLRSELGELPVGKQ